MNNDPSTRSQLSMKDTHKGILMASLLAINLTRGLNNVTLGGSPNGNGTKAADVGRIVVYPLEQTRTGNASAAPCLKTVPAEYRGGANQLSMTKPLIFAVVALALLT